MVRTGTFLVFKATPDGKVELNVEQTAQALLITYCMFCNIDGSSDIELWEKIYEPHSVLCWQYG